MRSSPAAVFATCIGATSLSAPVTPIVSLAGASPAASAWRCNSLGIGATPPTSTPSAAGGAAPPTASSTPSATQPPTSLSAPAPPIVSLADASPAASAWRCNSPGIGATPATSTPSAAGGASPAASTPLCANVALTTNPPTEGATPAAPPTPSATQPPTPSDAALKMVQKHYPSPSTTSGQTPLLGYSSHFASPLQSLNESLDLQLTHTPPARPDPLHKRRRVEPSLNISDKAHAIWSPWDENPSSEAKENINVTVKEVKKELRDIGTSLNKVACKGRRKGANLSFKSGEIDKAKQDCQKLHKTPMKCINNDWHKEAQQFIKEWSYVRKL